jgi:hypothetical protein
MYEAQAGGAELMAFIARTFTLEDRWRQVKSFPWVGECPADDGRHDWIWRAAKGCAASLMRITPEQAEELIRHDLTRPEQHPNEIRHSVGNAYKRDYSGSSTATPRVEFGDYDPDLLAEIAMEGPEVTPEQLARRSPVSVDVSAAEFFRLVFPGEKVFATTWPMTKSGFVYEGPNEAEELQRYLDGNKQGAWFLSNPVDGVWRDTVDGNQTVRSEANLTNFRHIVLESDVAPADQWLVMLVQQPLAIVALYRSGGRSIHALVRINAKNKAEFDRLRVKYCPLGADPAAMSAVRLTRVPNVIRADNFAYQRLLYCNPKPIARAIYQDKTL